ncbi:MAG: hypothetical protein COA42_19225 [Alteromonadaceae bacterium]|nr:MAG: hypothetical protein COA42_19225 [Alteromonadaceae bacterium]
MIFNNSDGGGMNSKEDFYRNILIIGWIQLLQIVVVMFIVSILIAGVDNDFSGFAKDPGMLGVDVMVVVFAIYAILPLVLKGFGSVYIRWANFGLTIFFFLFFLVHQLSHLFVDNIPLSWYHLLDFVHHIVILAMVWVSFLWARCNKT